MISRTFEYISPERSQFPKSSPSGGLLSPVDPAHHRSENLIRQPKTLSLSLRASTRKPYHLNYFHRAANCVAHPHCDLGRGRLVCLGFVRPCLSGGANLRPAAFGVLPTGKRLPAK